MNVSLMKVSLSTSCVVPHDLAVLTQGQIVEAIAQAVVGGQLPAKLNIELAAEGCTLADVRPIFKEMWLDRFSADVFRMGNAQEELAGLETDDSGRIEQSFLVWIAGTPLVDIRRWFTERKRGE